MKQLFFIKFLFLILYQSKTQGAKSLSSREALRLDRLIVNEKIKILESKSIFNEIKNASILTINSILLLLSTFNLIYFLKNKLHSSDKIILAKV